MQALEAARFAKVEKELVTEEVMERRNDGMFVLILVFLLLEEIYEMICLC